ncbi:hypothetical protein C8J57DRAFT_1342242 [Mycena rebaudengoi]|nr:hypothetical protein C8J57DRAFT_1342242 [Mycena rebaudengoi]
MAGTRRAFAFMFPCAACATCASVRREPGTVWAQAARPGCPEPAREAERPRRWMVAFVSRPARWLKPAPLCYSCM